MKLSVFFGIFIRIGTDTEMLLVPIQLGVVLWKKKRFPRTVLLRTSRTI